MPAGGPLDEGGLWKTLRSGGASAKESSAGYTLPGRRLPATSRPSRWAPFVALFWLRGGGGGVVVDADGFDVATSRFRCLCSCSRLMSSITVFKDETDGWLPDPTARFFRYSSVAFVEGLSRHLPRCSGLGC